MNRKGRARGMKKVTGRAAALMAGAVLLVLAGCGDVAGPTEGPDGWQEYTLDGFTFEWKVEDSTGTIRIKLTAPTTGWLAVGFDPTSFMNEADLLIGFVSGGTAQARDDYGTGSVTHESDLVLGGTDDLELITGSETAGETVLEFRIPLNSGDAYDKVLAAGTTYTVIFAYGENGADDFTSGHAWAETASLEL